MIMSFFIIAIVRIETTDLTGKINIGKPYER